VSALLALALISSRVPASSAATPADIAATEAYLRADYQLNRALLANIPVSNAAAMSFAVDVGGECHGVLASAPSEELDPSGPPTPRARGELQRSQLQMNTIQDELGRSFYAATYQSDRAAYAAYASQVASLSWTDPRIAVLVRFEANRSLEDDTPMVGDPCSDMKAWAQSGYHVLSPSSKAFEAAQQARQSQTAPTGSIGALLKPSEGPAARTLLRRTHALRLKLATVIKPETKAYGALTRDLGVPEAPFEESEDEPVIAQGNTEAGDSYTVRRQSKQRNLESSCRRGVSVELQEASKNGRASHSSGGSICLSAPSNRRPSGRCGEGVQEISAAVAASVWSVRLRLSNGRTITSKVIHVPPREGGPGGVYVQAIRGSIRTDKPYAVSLTELDRHGHVVHRVNLGYMRCRPETGRQGPTLVPLASGTTPGGEPFSIEGVEVRFGENESSFNLELSAGARSHNDEASITLGGPPVQPKAFSWSLSDECQPHPFSIIYGTLAPPGISVLVRTPSGLVPLTEVQISASLGAEGPLFYGVFTEAPTELVVQGSNGMTLYSESLIAKGREEAEFCEGYVEA
jgi:hypothetical protein